MKRKVHCLCFVLACLAALPACATPLRYSAEPIEATVIDAETKQPLEGVVVTANWQLEEGTFGGNVQAGQLMVMEAVTDKDGKFRFPSWGPTTVWRGHLVNDDPQLLLFKSGYEYQRLYNHVSMSAYREYVLKPVRRSDWNGKTIELKPFKGTVEEYAKRFENLNYELEHIATGQPEDCHWKKLQKVITEMNREHKSLEEKGINPYTLHSVDKELLRNSDYYAKKGGPSCGSPKEFFRIFQK